jgi:hypothetical protein
MTDRLIREKMWVTRPVGTHLSESQKKPGRYSPLTRDDDTNELGQVTLDPIDEDEADSSASPPVWDYGTTAHPSTERSEAHEELYEAIAVLIVAVIRESAVVAAPYIREWWDGNALPAMKSTLESTRTMTSTMTSTLASTLESARSKIARARRSDRQADAGEMVVFIDAPTSGPSIELAALPAEDRARMSSAEAQQRLVAAIMAKTISERAQAFSDEQMKILLGAVIEDADDLPAISAIERLTEEIEAGVNRILEANPALLKKFARTYGGQWAADSRETVSRSLDPRGHGPAGLGAG